MNLLSAVRALTMLYTISMLPDAGAAEPPAWAAKLDGELAAIAGDAPHPLASLSVLAVRSGAVVYQKQFGQRFVDPQTPSNNRRAGEATLYRVASISKLVTTLGVMRLVEDGKLDLDKDVSDYLGFALRNPHFPDDRITLRMLLSHTSSLRDDAGYYWDAKHALKDIVVPGGSLYASGAMWASNAKPGAYFQYSNLAWGIIGTIMECVSGERFDRLMNRLVLDPMALRGGFHPADFSAADVANLAALYRKRTTVNGIEVWDPRGPWVAQVDDYSETPPVPRAGNDYAIGSNGTVFGPQGNLRLSAAGLGKVMLMLMNGGVSEGRQILKPASVATMLARGWRHDASANGGNGESTFGGHARLFNAWGLGNQHFLDIGGAGSGDRLVEGGGFSGIGHLGEAWGLTAAFVFDPATRNGMIYLSGGPGFDPTTYGGEYSSLYRYEEKILTALHARAIVQRTE